MIYFQLEQSQRIKHAHDLEMDPDCHLKIREYGKGKYKIHYGLNESTTSKEIIDSGELLMLQTYIFSVSRQMAGTL